jgi:hypothetical protein
MVNVMHPQTIVKDRENYQKQTPRNLHYSGTQRRIAK